MYKTFRLRRAEFELIEVVDNPIIAHKLAQLRDKRTPSKIFRELVEEIAMLMTYEVGREFESDETEIETPLATCRVKILHEENFVIVPILRAGLGMASGVLKIFPNASVGPIGLYRDEKTFQPVEYYSKMPPNLDEKILLVTDPMLATGGSASAALKMLKDKGARKILFLCIVAAPQGVEKISSEHPDVPIYTATLDEGLNENCYILPGLGDAGDRIFGF
ncbi:MAG: uracil phosphoribosyltransferase [Selenomonadaceae bacterium]|nr:uracil phosphoribosyltransferase [Selenomonadaceae bacterium]